MVVRSCAVHIGGWIDGFNDRSATPLTPPIAGKSSTRRIHRNSMMDGMESTPGLAFWGPVS